MTSQPPTPYRRKLIEVALPLEAINVASAHEKMPGIGPHPRGLHLWWARRPLVACRAVIFASLVDDPSAWPEIFPTDEAQEAERQRIFHIVEELVIWENSTNEAVLLKAHTEIARSLARSRKEPLPEGKESIRSYIAEHAPPVYDPFCGGGSIPLEAQRLGLKAYGSDLNPIAVLITKALIEIPPKFAGMPPVNPESLKNTKLSGGWEGTNCLAEDVRYYGQWMRDEAERRIGDLYPKVKVTKEMAEDRPDLVPYVGQELTVIAWLWARTVKSPNPAAGGAEVPLISTFWLSKKKGKEAWLEPIVNKFDNSYQFKVRIGAPESLIQNQINKGTKNGRAVFACLLTDTPISGDYIDTQATEPGLGTRLLAIVAEGNRERVYLNADSMHVKTSESAKNLINYEKVPNESSRGTFAGNAQGRYYGFRTFGNYFTPRQLVALTTFSDLVLEARSRVLADATRIGDDQRYLTDRGVGPEAYADAVATYLAFCIDRCADFNNSLCRWVPGNQKIMNLFSRQAIPMVWDYAEANIMQKVVGGFPTCLEYLVDCIFTVPNAITNGEVIQLDAGEKLLEKKSLISTDPPYYDNIGYADLSDFFYVWLRRVLKDLYPTIFSTVITPKNQELIACQYRHEGSKTKAMKFFENGLGCAFKGIYTTQNPTFPMTVYYAFKQSEAEDTSAGSPVSSTGWETMLSGLILAGFMVIGTWPMRSEQSERIIAAGTNALASSIVLVCRPRPVDAPTVTRREFLTALKQELPQALHNLQQGLIAPVDLAQATIGPGMAVFTRYAEVMESDGSPMTVRTALGIINQTLDEVLAEQEGVFDADTRWAVSWFEQYGMQEGPYGEAETLSKAKNVAVSGLVEAGVLTARGGKVQLIPRDQLPDDWNPKTDTRLPAWEATQHLIRALDKHGEQGAATLLSSLGGEMGERARDLAYRLYVICERKKWSTEALAYNSLIISWSEIQKLTRAAEPGARGQQHLG